MPNMVAVVAPGAGNGKRKLLDYAMPEGSG